MTPERIMKRAAKRAARNVRNIAGKELAAIARKEKMVAMGRTVIVTENEDGTKSYAFPKRHKLPSLNIPCLSHIAEKTRKTGVPRKNRPGLKPEHTAALIEDASRTLAKEIDKAMEVPAVDGEPIVPTIGEFADHDPAQGAAIDHSVATGAPLFAE